MDKQILDALRAVQAGIKCPKGRWNDHGKYHYRATEDIMAAAKPLLAKHGLTLTLTDEIISVAGDESEPIRIYVQTTARINGAVIASALARETRTRKGMDDAQITAAASSFARKVALQGIFLLDDGVDADSVDPDTDAAIEPKWFEWKVPFKRSANHGRTLGDIAADGDVDTLQKLQDYVANKKDGPGWEHVVKFCDSALAHARPIRDEKTPPAADPAPPPPPAPAESDPDDSVPF